MDLELKRTSVVVVGSGPSGVFAASSFLQKNISVQMFDVGNQFDNQDNSFIASHKLMIPVKKLFGSSYMYKRNDNLQISKSNNVDFYTSHAAGGLSTVWGATVGFCYGGDVKEWNIEPTILNEHIKSAFLEMRVTSVIDQIDELYSSHYIGGSGELINSQTESILYCSNKYRNILLQKKIFIGRSKLAVDTTFNSDKKCVLCNKCMSGCEFGSIYSSASMLEELKKNKQFTYFPKKYVDTYAENEESVMLNITDLINGECKSVTCETLILASGCFDTTKIVHNSLNRSEKKYTFKDSQKFYFPILSFKKEVDVNSKSIELAHLYLQMLDNKNRIIQIQLYPGKKIVNEILITIFGARVTKLIDYFFSPFINRFSIAMMYLHSDVSGSFTVNYKTQNKAVISGKGNSASTIIFIKTWIRLMLNCKYLGFLPIPFYIKSKIGHSQHFGSSLFCAALVNNSLDGAIGNSKRVFAVDSSIFPSIPATPTTSLIIGSALKISENILKKFY